MNASTHLRAVARSLDTFAPTALDRVQTEAQGIVARNGGPPLRGHKRRGLPVAMARNQHVTVTAGGATFRVQGTVPGWLWFDSGTRPHRIPRRRSGAKRRLVLRHPGSPGRHRWRAVVRELTQRVPQIVRDEMSRALG